MSKQLQGGQIILQIPEYLFPQFEKALMKFQKSEQKDLKLMNKLTPYFLNKFEEWAGQQNDKSCVVLECEKLKANTNVEYNDLKSLVKENQSHWSQFLKYCKITQAYSVQNQHLKGLNILIRDFNILQQKQQNELAAGKKQSTYNLTIILQNFQFTVIRGISTIQKSQTYFLVPKSLIVFNSSSKVSDSVKRYLNFQLILIIAQQYHIQLKQKPIHQFLLQNSFLLHHVPFFLSFNDQQMR
ncbi:hypothetical protein pb186bvf_009774 [Paramecium bursaria]